MKTFIKSFFLIFLGVLSGCNKSTKSTRLYGLNKDTLYFGLIKQSDTFYNKIFCKNYSKSKINILKIEPGCGCTKTFFSDSVINVGDSIPIFVKYIPAQNHDSGNIIKYITVRTNSNPAFLNLIIIGKVVK